MNNFKYKIVSINGIDEYVDYENYGTKLKGIYVIYTVTNTKTNERITCERCHYKSNDWKKEDIEDLEGAMNKDYRAGIEFTYPKLDETSNFMKYLIEETYNSENHMVWIEDEDDKELLIDDGFDLNEIDADKFDEEVKKLNLENFIEYEINDNHLSKITCYGGLPSNFILKEEYISETLNDSNKEEEMGE